MEYCCGGELFTLMKRQPRHRLTEEQILFYSSEVLLVLEFVHLNGYIYRGFFSLFLILFPLHFLCSSILMIDQFRSIERNTDNDQTHFYLLSRQ